MQGSMQPLSLTEQGAGTLRVILGEREQLSTSLGGNDSSNQKKAKKLLPGETGRGAEFVDEIERKAATEETRRLEIIWYGVYLSKPVKARIVARGFT
jgi:hypothetical protein